MELTIMINLKTKSIVSSFALGVLAVASSQATNAQASSQGSMSIDQPVVLDAEMISTSESRRSTNGAVPLVSTSSFTGICAYHFNGTNVKINCSDPRIQASSRVFMTISEYSTAPGVDAFVGDARMTVHNVSPHAGGVSAKVDVEWGNPLNVQVSVFVDP
jgi:hypothetical protein